MKRLLPYACLLLAALLVVIVPPPTKLVELIGSDVWARLGLGVLVALILFMFLICLGLAAGKVGLPFGLSLERSQESIGPGPKALEALAVEMRALREADERIFERIGALAALVETASERIVGLEQPETDPKGLADGMDPTGST